MSTEPKTAVDQPSPKHHRPVQSGLSVLARGESFVWLTGGMLVVAIGMIATLLGFIFYRGTSTFWPHPFAVYPTRDGGFTAGELESTESFRYDANQLASLSPAAQQAALGRLGDSESASANRTYLRVGNFDLSGQHYGYLNEFEQSSDQAVFPENLWLAERLHNGRFYGWPVQLHERFDPAFESKTKSLSAAESLVQTLALYANDDNPFDATQAEIAIAALAKERQQLASSYFANVVLHTPLAEGEHWEAMLPSGDWQKIEPSAIPGDATAIRLSATTYSSIKSAFESAQGSILGLIQRSEELQQELAHGDEALKDARLELRQIEIDHDMQFMDRVGELEADWSTMGIAKVQLEDQAQALQAIESNGGIDATVKAKLKALFAIMRTELEGQISQLQSNSDTTLGSLGQIPTACQDAIARYRDTVIASAASQTRLNAKIADTESEIRSAAITFKSSTVQTVQEVAPDIAEPLVASESAKEVAPNTWWIEEPSAQGIQVRFIAKVDNQWKEAMLQETQVDVAEIVRAYSPNRLSTSEKASVMLSRWGEFLTGLPREAGMEGGFFPAIWGTIVMTMIMALFVVPFGVLAALYLREYATSGFVVGVLRIAINNLAGVPSVVYGVFGLAFFCYVVGGYIDGGPERAGIVVWPPLRWYLALAVVAIIAVSAFFLSFYCSGSPMAMGPWRRFGRSASGLIWMLAVIGFVMLIAKSPFFDGFYQASLPNPTFGKGGLIWASLTLALLTLPVVIVATEEALAAVPNSLREGSYACGAGKWQTIQRIVLPHARPGIMTGTILAMARGAGEVAPMMLVGALPLAIELPLDGEFPFFHGSRSFMHLGFQIYALGFQGQNSEAAKPMVFTTTLLLIVIVLLLNLVAIILRTRLRKRFQGVQF